jgi:predicted HicB family RNase H-like nuclease
VRSGFHCLVIPGADMSKSKILNLRIDPELKKRAKKLAEEDGRSLSNWVTRLIEKEVKRADRSRS